MKKGMELVKGECGYDMRVVKNVTTGCSYLDKASSIIRAVE
jgi:hypothetical protein